MALLSIFIFLFLENYGVRKLEAVFAVLIATMALSFAWMFGEAKPSGTELLIGCFVKAFGRMDAADFLQGYYLCVFL
ncbi:hypothetical protein PRUPE_3G166200 [Prunus persica]|uniref:Uncharacterized protein n=1 Tax=Prunus persica TaxID=3760 RepID=M5WWI0_PRUPE|nr:hypothetical protein PRUPE_3G166200 [Prunus persica]